MALVLKDVKILQSQCFVMHYDLSIPQGSFMTIVGGPKSGRSSLLHAIAGFETPLSGYIYLEERAMHRLSPSERPLTMIFQDNNLFNQLTLFENISLGLKGTLHLSAREQREALEIISYVGLQDDLNKKPKEVSSYIQQKAAVARSIFGKKPLLLLDEPFGAIRREERHAFAALLKEVHKTFQLTTLMAVSHIQDAEMLSSLIAFIGGDRVVHIEPVDTLFDIKRLKHLLSTAEAECNKMRLAC